MVFGIATVTAAITGTGLFLANSLAGRADLRPVARAPSPRRLTWALPSAEVAANRSVIAERVPEQAQRHAVRWPALDPLGGLALVIPAISTAKDDRVVTGSLGGALIPRRVSLEVIRPTRAVPAPKVSEAASRPALKILSPLSPAPLPRARPQLASLTPLDGIPIKPEEETRAPRTAIYDISARTVYMPNGERLEAHSGLGEFMDDPTSMRHRNRGVTPPNTYALSLRESPFHGVQAIRLTPANEELMFGRDGMLAHSYMLGPSGQSNGCISFKDYPRFLRAFQRGEVDRVVVVPRLARSPAYAARAEARSADNMRSRDNVF